MRLFLIFLFAIAFAPAKAQLYFPPVGDTAWATISPAELGWCSDEVDSLIDYVGSNNTKAFLVLKDGKIVIEKYYGSFVRDSMWYWASAGKSLTAFLMGLAQEQGYLSINDPVSTYLGHGFSSCDSTAEDSILIRHQLTMTSGFDDFYGGVSSENHCTDDSCLVCIATPGTRWAYHNAPYTLTHNVMAAATGVTVNAFKNTNLNISCGITGLFLPSGYDDVYYSTARSFARFGLLTLGQGVWDGDTILHDTAYFQAMVNTSQPINLSYGYLWWLNGKASFHLPNTQFEFPGPAEPDAPADMIAALGKNDQILNVVPSMGLVLVRMGNPMATAVEVANVANDSIWVHLNKVFCSSGIATTSHPAPLSLFPNPATHEIQCSTPAGAGPVSFSIFSMDGRVLIVSNTAHANVSTLSPGIYFARLQCGGESRVGRFWKE